MDERFEKLFETVREDCAPARWSRGIELTRAGAVISEPAEDPDELRFRISQRGGMISRVVSLYLDTNDWDCFCDLGDDACEHVAACVIASKRSDEGGEGVRTAEETGHLLYRLSNDGGRLALERLIVAGGEEHRLTATLAALASGKVRGPRFTASQADLAIELTLGTHRHGALAPGLVPRLLRELKKCGAVEYDSEPVDIELEPLQPVVRLEDLDSDLRLILVEPEQPDERFANGAVRIGRRIRPSAAAHLTARELQDYRRGVRIPAERLGELIDEVLPQLKRRTAVEIATERLPSTERIPPRLAIESERNGEELSVLATLVYGDPVQARVDAGRLVHLQGAVPIRQLQDEKRLTRELRESLGLAPGVRSTFRATEAVVFAARLAESQSDIRSSPEAETALKHFELRPDLQGRFELSGSQFDVSFESDADGTHPQGKADPSVVLEAWRNGESLVPLLDGGYAALPADWLEKFGGRIADLLAARDVAEGDLPAALLPELSQLAEELDCPPSPQLENLRERFAAFDGIPRATLPSDLNDVTLRGYQQKGVDWLRFNRDLGVGSLLADDMGLGKTLQALCALEGRTLVVAPTSVLQNWQREAQRFRPSLSICYYHGPNRVLDPEADLTLTSYALLRLDRDKLTEPIWDTLVLDEAQAIKNPQSQVASAAFDLRAHARITLTGTPVENRLDELWSQFHFLNRGLLGGRTDFQQRYVAPINGGDESTAARLRARTRPFVLRRLKKEVAPELPPRTDLVLRCTLNKNERELYQSIHAATRKDVIAKLQQGGGVMAALEALLRLRQASCHPALIPGQTAERSSKLDLLAETLDEVIAEGHKALVFSQWTSLLDQVEPVLTQASLLFTRLDGSTADRGAVVDAFQADDGPPILLISLRAGGTGLNLTAADHVFLLDPWWNPAVEDQAADRAHRIGQTKPVMVHRLIAEDTVEERILALQADKRRLADAALTEGGAAAGLRREDLLELLDG